MLLLSDFLDIDFFFRCINAGIVLALIVHFFNKYGLPRLRTMLVHQEDERRQRIYRKKLLEERLNAVVVEQHEQEMTYRTLQERVTAWKKAVADEQERYILVYRSIKAKVLEKRQQQAELLEFQKIKSVIMPRAVEEARHELEKMFAHKGEGYIKATVLRMKDAL